uniref:Protein bicaudal D n=1 Tax=Macrostomum lignano TaxID=282301 RepID=A0A1I8G439_9PLAT
MRKEFEEKIREQERLTEEARRELQELSEKHEAEKAEMFELVKQFGLSSFSTDNFRSNDAGTMTDSSAETLKLVERISLGSSGARAGQGAETSREAQSQPASIDSFCFLVQLRKKASSIAKELVEARSQLQQSSEYSENLQRCSHQVDAANCDLYKEIEGHKKQISAVSQVAEEIREKFILEARRVAKLETKLASLRQENSELQCRDATLRLAQVSDASEIASLNRRLDEAKRGLAQAAETADLANKKLEETRLEMEKLKAKYQSTWLDTDDCCVQTDPDDNAFDIETQQYSMLLKKLNEKQAELDKLLKDLKESRNKVKELNEILNVYKNDTTKPEVQTRQVEASQLSYATDLKRYSESIEAVNDRLHRRLQESNRQRDSVIEVAEELRNRLLAESRQLTELRQEYAELQADNATLRLAQARDCSHCAIFDFQIASSLSESDLQKMEQSSQPARKFKHYGNRGMRPAMQGENSDAQKDKTIRELRKQLEEKQMDLDSLLQDFDETRHTVYQLNEKVKEYKSRAEQRAAATGRLEKLLAEKQVELDSVLEDFDETRHKVYELNEKIKDYERRSDRRDNVANVRADGDVSKLQTQLTKKQEELDGLTEDLDETRHKVYQLNEKVKDYEN